MKAFIFDPLWDELVTSELRARLDTAGVELVISKDVAPLSSCKPLFDGDEERILCLNPDYVEWNLSSDNYKDIPNLVGIFGAATGYHWIDKTYADANNIPICNVVGFSAEAVAEWAILMMLNLARQTPRLVKDGFPLDYDKDFMKYRGIELHGKTVGIVGLGRVGMHIADRCKGLGMNVVYWSRNPKSQDLQSVELDELFKTADVIFPTMAINEQSKAIITQTLLGSMKKSAILVSIVHGLFDEQIPLKMVREGELFGFGFEDKPRKFSEYEGNVWAAPEYAWVTDASLQNSMKLWVDNMVNAAKGEFPNRVN